MVLREKKIRILYNSYLLFVLSHSRRASNWKERARDDASGKRISLDAEDALGRRKTTKREGGIETTHTMSLCHTTTTTTTTTTTETTKRWYALVRMDEDGRSVAPQAEEIAKLERELMRQSGHPNEEGQGVASEEMFLHTNYHSGRNATTTNAESRGTTQKKTKTMMKTMMMVQDENDTSATSAKQATLGAPPSRLGQKRGGHAANSDGTESAKEGSTSPSTASETIMTSENKSSPSKKRKKETPAKEKKKESHGGTATTTNAASLSANYTNNRGGAESARGTNMNTNATTREVPPGCKPGGPCDHCGALDSPQWRRGPASKPCLCNACGTRFRRTNFLAPVANNNNNNNKDNNKQDNGEDNNGSTGGVNKRNLDMDGQSTKKRSVAAAC